MRFAPDAKPVSELGRATKVFGPYMNNIPEFRRLAGHYHADARPDRHTKAGVIWSCTDMENQLIETPENYAAALREIDGLMSAEPGTAEGRRLEILADLVEKYEAKHFPMNLSTGADEGLPIDE